jgi:hypothetical protein
LCCVFFIFYFLFFMLFLFLSLAIIYYINNNTRFTTMKLNNGLRNWINRCKEYAKLNGCSYKVAMSKLGKKGTRRGNLRGGGVADHAEAFTPVSGNPTPPPASPASPPPPPATAVAHTDPFTVSALPQAQTGGGLGMFEVGGAPQSLTGGRRRRRRQTGGRKKCGSKKRSSRRSRSHRGGSGSSSSLSYSDYS